MNHFHLQPSFLINRAQQTQRRRASPEGPRMSYWRPDGSVRRRAARGFAQRAQRRRFQGPPYCWSTFANTRSSRFLLLYVLVPIQPRIYHAAVRPDGLVKQTPFFEQKGKRREGHLPSSTLDSVYSVEGAVGGPLRPPTGFSDSRELSEAECDRDPGQGGHKGVPQQHGSCFESPPFDAAGVPQFGRHPCSSM
ncbi:hypothetical protein GWK47_008515 [Chionoecetes opilio]|uniref:Uncharacterized protein n=1 Tax=Chionoecetes opilio TaxID=41210 RepID=A0A8J4Y8Q9_CHIOP|nr:hypothetical protein GWK47_008515 [Chionoecetes opilio]